MESASGGQDLSLASMHLFVKLLLDKDDFARFDDEVTSIDVSDDELVLGGQRLVLPEQDLLDRLGSIKVSEISNRPCG